VKAERSTQSRLLKSLAVFSTLSVLRRGIPFLLLPVYVIYVDAQEYGVLTAVTISASIVAVVSNLRLDAAVRTFYFDYATNESLLREYMRQVITVATLCGGLLFAAALAGGDAALELVFAHDEIRFFPEGAIALATACLMACVSPYFTYLRIRHALRELIIWELLLLVATVTLQLTFVAGLGLGLTGILWGALLPVVATGLLICLTQPWLIARRIDWRMLQPSLRYTLPLIGLGLVHALGGKLDRLILVRHVQLAELGAYAIVFSIFGLLHIALNVLDNVFRPYLYPALRSNDAAAARVVDSCHKLYLLTGLLALSASVALSSNLHMLTNDPRYLVLQDWIPWVASAFAPTVVIRFHALALEATKRSWDMTAGITVRFLILAATLLVLVPAQGARGALWAVLIAGTTNAFMFAFVTRHAEALCGTYSRSMLQIGVLLSVVWLSFAVIGSQSISLFGFIQFAAVVPSLLWISGFRDVGVVRSVIAELATVERTRSR
jgi:O-antigen/teichoic acid export membrane protein